MAIPIKLQVFEGSMDLLMHLIEKNKIDIYDIPIVEITDQYLEYIRQMDRDDMNITSEFLVMAATLLDIKSRMLLPREENEEEEEEDPRDELVRRLLEYKMYKYMSEELRDRSEQAGKSFYRPQDLPGEVKNYIPPVNYEELIGDATVSKLERIFKDVLRRKKSRMDPIRSGFGEIRKEEINSAEKELYIKAYIREHQQVDFRELLEHQESKQEVIVTFLLLLEMMKTQEIHVIQDEIGGKILIEDTPVEKEVSDSVNESALSNENASAAETLLERSTDQDQDAEEVIAQEIKATELTSISGNEPIEERQLMNSVKTLINRSMFVEESICEDPSVEELTEEAAAIEEPATEEFAIEKPATEEPAIAEPITEEPDKDLAIVTSAFYYNVDHLFARPDKRLVMAARHWRSGRKIFRLERGKRLWRRRKHLHH